MHSTKGGIQLNLKYIEQFRTIVFHMSMRSVTLKQFLDTIREFQSVTGRLLESFDENNQRLVMQ